MPRLHQPVITLNATWLRYPPGAELHTATSGKVTGLRAVYLTLDYGDVAGCSEVRTNISYLTGVPRRALEAEIAERTASVALSNNPQADRERLDVILPSASAGLRLLLETALADAAARRNGTTVSGLLRGGTPELRARTNQTLFLGNDEAVLARADAYVARGFTQLKLRLGADTPERDLARLRLLRDRFGDRIVLSADVNCQWNRETAKRLAPALVELGLDYLEQPLAAEDLDGALALAADQPLAVMLDEGASDLEAVARIGKRAPVKGRVMVHLKLAKLGGLDRLAAAVDCARGAGLGVMIGQMNEGALATATTLAAVASLRPARAELYGADGLVNDPFSGLVYANGEVMATGSHGFGVERSRALEQFIAGEQFSE
jgi:L-alanine-DL-glutamate epimerase-like enolase superfamily enzyme